jgi:hypothetical protein
LIKQTPAIEAEEKHLPQGLEAIERITSQINEAIRKSENIEIVKDLEGRVEDWKGHKLEHFGELLLHGSFSVIKGDVKGEVEREVLLDRSLCWQRSLTDGTFSTTFISLSAYCCAARRLVSERNRTRRWEWERIQRSTTLARKAVSS